MFAVIRVRQEAELSRRERRRARRGRPTVSCRAVSAPFGIFQVAEIALSPSGPVWPMILRATGRRPLVLPPGLDPPPALAAAVLTDEEWRRRLLVDFVMAALRRSSGRPQLTLADPDGRYPGAAAELLPFTALLRVVTRRLRNYDGCCAYGWRRWGTAPVMVPWGSPLPPVPVLAPDGAGGLPLPSGTALFAPNDPAGITIPPGAVTLPPEIESVRSPHIPPLLFGAAVLHVGAAPALLSLTPEYARCRGRRITVDDAARFF